MVIVEEVGLWLCSYAARQSLCLVQNFGVGGVGVGVGVCSALGSQSCAARNSCVLWQKNRTKFELQLAKTACGRIESGKAGQGRARPGKAGQGRARPGKAGEPDYHGGLTGRQAGVDQGGMRGQQAAGA